MTRPPTFDHLRSAASFETVVPICLEPDKLDALAEAERSGDEKAIAAARAAVEEATTDLRVRSIGRAAMEVLTNQYPATDAQKAKAAAAGEPEPTLDEDAFAPALVAECLVKPRLSVAEVQELFDLWNVADAAALYVAAVEVNGKTRVTPFKLGSARTQS